MKKFTLFLASALFASTSVFAETKELVIGGEVPTTPISYSFQGTPNVAMNVPLNMGSQTHSQAVLPASMLSEMAGKKITSIAYLGSNRYGGTCGVRIRLASTEADAVTTAGIDTSDATLVYNGTTDFTTTSDYKWIEFEFSAPYEYDGTNLLIDNDNDITSSYAQYTSFGKSATVSIPWIYSNMSGAYRSAGDTPFIKFTYEDEDSVDPTPDPVFTFGGVLGADGAYTLDLGNVDLNSTASGVFTISGTDVTGDVTLSSTTLNLAQTTFTAEEIMAGVEVSFTRDITDLITVSDVITVTNGDATVGTVTVSWTPVDNTPVTPDPEEGASVTVTPATWEAGNVYAYADNSKVFTLNGKDITSDITITFSKDTTGESEWDTAYEFHFNEWWPYEESKTVTAEEANAEGGFEFQPFFTTYKTGEYTAEITISSTTGEFEDVVIPVSWNAINKPYINISPSWYEDLGTVAKGATVEKEITVYSGNLTEDITITATEGITLDKTVIAKDAENPATVKATVNTAEYGDYSGTVVFSTNDGDVTSELGLVWEVTDPEFSADNTELDFGEAKTGEALSKTITLTAKAVAGDVTVSSPTTEAVKVNATTIYNYEADGYELNVTLLPTDLTTNSDSFTLTAEGFDPITVNVKWTPVQGDVVNIAGTANDCGLYVPMNTYWNENYFETVYTADDVNNAEAGKLSAIAYPYFNDYYSDTKHFCVWVENTTDTAAGDEYTDVTTLTKVFEGDLTLEPGGEFSIDGAQWLKFPIEEGFDYTGGNLRVVVEAKSNGYSSASWLYDGTRAQKFLMKSADAGGLDSAEPYVNDGTFIVTKFCFAPKEAEPALEVSEDVWSIGDIEVGQSAEKTFTITGTDLTDDIEITHSCDAVTVSTDLIGSDEATEGYEIKVTVTPANTDDYEDEIVITSGSVTKTISIDWNATEPVSGIEAISFAEPTAVVVYDINGRCIKNEVVEGSMKETMSSLNSGIYVIKANKKAYKVQVK